MLHDIVTLNRDFENIPAGTKGTIVHDYGQGTYEVEFVNSENQTITVLTVSTNYIIQGSYRDRLVTGNFIIVYFDDKPDTIKTIYRITKIDNTGCELTTVPDSVPIMVTIDDVLYFLATNPDKFKLITREDLKQNYLEHLI